MGSLMDEDKPGSIEYEFQIVQDGMEVAGGSGFDRERVESEARHYGMQYAQDCQCEVIVSAKILLSKTNVSHD